METEFLKSLEHCFIDRDQPRSPDQLPALTQRALFTLDDYDFSHGDFGGFPEYPPDCIEGRLLRPTTDLTRLEWTDETGDHLYDLSRIKTSLTQMLAAVPDDQTEAFCRRWSEHWIYSPFQGWENYSPEEALKQVRQSAYAKQMRFFPMFRSLCRKALADQTAIFFLWERHERPLD